MKIYLLPAAVLLLVYALGCSDQDADENRREKHDEVPDRIMTSKPCSTLYKGIISMFPEHKKNSEAHNYLFAGETEKKIIVKQETEVYITFISEGAGFKNSLGWYSYDAAKPPGSASGLDKKILFPHVSDDVLAQGDMLQVGDGKFKAGTVIGFFLIARGWEDGVVNFGKKTYYTDNKFNINQYQQHILFKEGKCGDIVMAFEDRALDDPDCDFDYNDVIFTIADNKDQLETVQFDLSKITVIGE